MTRASSTAMQSAHGLFAAMWETGLWRYFTFLLIYSIGFATVFPVIPTIITNGFASQAAGRPLDCQQFTPATAPVECRDAHAQAVTWNSWTSFVSGTVLSSMCAPAVGRASDVIGRRPFILVGVGLALAPMAVIMAHVWGWCRIEWYFPLTALGGVVSSFSMTMVAVADLLPARHRATAAGYISASFSIGVLVGPLAGGLMSTLNAVYTSLALIGATWLFVLLCIPESAPALRGPPKCRCRSGGPCTCCRASAADQGSGRGGASGRLSYEEQQPLLVPKQKTGSGMSGDGVCTDGAGLDQCSGTYMPPAVSSVMVAGKGAGSEAEGSPAGRDSWGSGAEKAGGAGSNTTAATAGEDLEGCGCEGQASKCGCEGDEGQGMLQPLLQLEGDLIPPVVPHSHELHVPPSASAVPMHIVTHACVSRRSSRDSRPAGSAPKHGGMHVAGSAPEAAPLLAHAHAPCEDDMGMHGEIGGAAHGVLDGREGDGSSREGGPCGRCSSNGSSSMLVGWRIIRGSAWYTKLTLVWVIVSMTNEGAQDLLMQYLQLKLGFNTRDQANLLVIVAGCGLAIKLALLPGLVRLLGEQWLLVVGLMAYAAECLCFALATTKGVAFGAIAIGSFACLNWPATIALQTKHVAPENMGAVTGALQGISSVASGIGPLFFAALFSHVTRDEPGCIYMPQIVWYVACGLTLSAVAVTATLHRSAPKQPLTLESVMGGGVTSSGAAADRGSKQDEESRQQREALNP